MRADIGSAAPSLFRAEALVHASRQAPGAVLRAQPLAFSVLAALFVAMALGIVAFLFGFSVTRSVQLPGVLRADESAAGPLVAELYASDSAIGQLQPGMTVLIHYDAFPFERFGAARGTVLTIAAPRLGAAVCSGASAEAGWRIRVRLERQTFNTEGRMQVLLAGLALEARIPLQRRRLIEWLFHSPAPSAS